LSISKQPDNISTIQDKQFQQLSTDRFVDIDKEAGLFRIFARANITAGSVHTAVTNLDVDSKYVNY